MLNHSYSHISGVGPAKEKRLWAQGMTTWETILTRPDQHTPAFVRQVEESRDKLAQREFSYFTRNLSSKEHWRLTPHVLDSVAYVDIETTGPHYKHGGKITTIALYDGNTVRTYVRGRNLYDFVQDIQPYECMVTYNGRCFDQPFIQHEFDISLQLAHIDLRYVLRAIGLTGGLKGCEKAIGISRDELDGVDGSFAVILWDMFNLSRNPRALETLLAYNVEDVINLEKLLLHAYEHHINRLPFATDMPIPSKPAPATNPHTPDPAIIQQVRTLFGL